MKRELNKYLSTLSEKELIKEVKNLYDKFNNVKKYYEMELSGDSDKILAEFKKRIKKEYFPSRGYGRARNGESRKVITEFKKISIHKKDIIELLLYRTDMMLAFTEEYGTIDEAFYNSLESGFEQACKLISQENLVPNFRKHCQELINRSYSFGWGVSDGFEYSYEEYLT